MSDGPTPSAVEGLMNDWRDLAKTYRRLGGDRVSWILRAAELEQCANELARALEEDGVIPSRMK